MVNSQILTNRVTDAAVEQAMLTVPREDFVPKALASVAYLDDDLEIAPGRYLVEPMIIARLLQAAELTSDALVLDVGCGTGYSTAVLARLAGTVVGLDADETLVETANATLNRLSIDNAAVVAGDMKAGLAKQGPFDVIFVNGAIDAIPDAWYDQLSDSGRIVAVLQQQFTGRAVRAINTGHGHGITPLFDANTPTLRGFEAKTGFRF